MFIAIKDLRGQDDVACALGNMIVAWSYAEDALVEAMSAVGGIEINQALHGFYRIPTFESRIKFILAMIPDWHAATMDKAEFVKAIEAISGLAGTRNGWVHNSWMVDISIDRTGISTVNMRSKRGAGAFKPVKAHDIRDHTAAVIRRADALRDLLRGQRSASGSDVP